MIQPRARATDPATSHAAAASMCGLPLAEQHGRILFALQFGGPGTVYDLAFRCIGMPAHAIGKRLSELEAAGRIEPTGETREGPSGRACRVWRVNG